MKPVFKCDYCKFMGTEEEVREHEPKCEDNYDKRSCHTCIHKRTNTKDCKIFYECLAGVEIPKGRYFEFCDKYERKEKIEPLFNTFSGLFGW